VVSGSALLPGDLIRLDITDSLFWGHLVHLRVEASVYNVGVEIERVLMDGSDIAHWCNGC
jgi:hypothetical protein